MAPKVPKIQQRDDRSGADNSSELAVSMFGGISVGDYHIEGLIAGESVKPLTELGTLKQKMGDFESAVVLFESALEYLGVAEASGYYRGGPGQRETIENQLRTIKREMGLISPSDEVTVHREKLNRMIQKNEDEMLIATIKQQLAAALKKTDPPQYFEAVKLLKEASAVITRLFGPEHKIAAMVNHYYDKTKKEYMLYLQYIAKKGKKQT